MIYHSNQQDTCISIGNRNPIWKLLRFVEIVNQFHRVGIENESTEFLINREEKRV